MPVPDPSTLAPLLAPIPGSAPAGRDIRYDPRYDAIREARREDVDLPQGALGGERKLADWARVQKETIALLTNESKDLHVAAWYTEAQLKRSGLGGLAGGLTVLEGLLAQYWDGLFPELDEDGDAALRLGALDWVGGRLDVAVFESSVAQSGLRFLDIRDARAVPTEDEATASDDKQRLRDQKLKQGKIAPEAVAAQIAATPKAYYRALVADSTAAVDALDALERRSEALFTDEAPSYRGLRAALDEVLRFASATLAARLVTDPDPVEEAAPEPAADDPASDAVGGTLSGASSGTPAGAATGALTADPVSPADAALRVASVARYLRQQDPTAAAPFLLLRGLRWGELRSFDGALDPKLLDPPAAGTRTRLRTLLLDGKWVELLEQGELAMATPAGRGWLDLQRYTLTACARLGPQYDAIADAVRGAFHALLAAVPQLTEMTFMDDTPTGNGETLDWIDGEEFGAAANGAAGDEDVALPDGSGALADALEGEHEGDLLAAVARGTAVRRSGGRRRADRGHGNGRNGDGADPFVLAKAELARGRTNRAVELLVTELDRERSARGRFVRQTQIAQVMVEAGLPEVARPILRQLVTTIEEKGLELWEAGPLIAQPMVLMCRVIDALKIETDERSALYLKVCRLDPLQAIALRRAT